jgi:hypothetical protein
VAIAKILPLAFVMIAGPQIITAIFLSMSEEWRQNSAASIAGAALSITATITIAYFVSAEPPEWMGKLQEASPKMSFRLAPGDRMSQRMLQSCTWHEPFLFAS